MTTLSHSEVGKTIRVLQAQAGMTNEHLADRLGVSRQTITNYRNATDMKLSTLLEILLVFGIKPDQYFKEHF